MVAIPNTRQFHSTISWKCIGSNERDVLWDNNAIKAGSSKAAVSMRVNSESISNEVDENDLQSEKYDEERIRTCRGIVIDLREGPANEFDSPQSAHVRRILQCDAFEGDHHETEGPRPESVTNDCHQDRTRSLLVDRNDVPCALVEVAGPC
jgi:hypothetical protein